jgi:hypothetical protein
LALAAVLIVLGVVIAGLPRTRPGSDPLEAAQVALSHPDNPGQVVNENPTQPAPFSGERSEVVEPAAASAPVSTPEPPPAPVPGAASTPSETPVMPPANGTLAISSPTAVEIYKDGAYLGSVPISLELPAGTQTLEYRHGILRSNVTHVINSNETTRARITFDVTLQINSRPWADVFIDGVEKKAVGQTPLSGVRVPIGSVLIFENPQFQAKRYRVTGNETGVQIVFP